MSIYRPAAPSQDRHHKERRLIVKVFPKARVISIPEDLGRVQLLLLSLGTIIRLPARKPHVQQNGLRTNLSRIQCKNFPVDRINSLINIFS